MRGKGYFPSPLDFRKQNESDQLNRLTWLFFDCCSDMKPFIAGKVTIDYGRIRNTFRKDNRLEQNILYDYLYSLKESNKKHLQDLKELYQNAEKYRQEIIMNEERVKTKELRVQQYEEYSIKDLEDL